MKKNVKYSDFLSGIWSFLLTLAVLLSAFLAGGLFPFGKSTLSWCDMTQQVIPLFCNFKDILSGDSSLFLNLGNAGGMNFYGVFFFFLSSPFTFLVALTDKSDIPLFMNILVLLKLGVSAFTASYVFNKTLKNSSAGISAVLGCGYALCGYGMLFFQNIMWLDMMYLFPIVYLGCYRLIKENRPLTLLLSLCGCVILNFYISFMVYLFVIIFFGLYALFYKKIDRKIYSNLALCGVFSLLSTAFVWLPSLLQYTSSGRTGSFLEEIKRASFFAPYETTLPILLSSGILVASVLLTLPSFYKQKTSIRFLYSVFAVTALPLIIEPFNLMWHTGSYMSFPARYGFITVFIGLILAGKTLNSIEFSERPRKRSVFIYLLSGIICIFALILTLSNTDTLSRYTQTLWGNSESLKGAIIICSLFTSAFGIIIFSAKRKILCLKTAVVFLSLTMAFEGFCWSFVYMVTPKDSLNLYNYRSIISLKDEVNKEGFYRVNTSHKLTDANMIGAAGFNSLSHYTSLNHKTFMESAKQLGYSGYWMETGNWGGSILSDTLLSIGYKIYNRNGEFSVEENPYFLGLGIKTSGKIPQTLSHNDRLYTLGQAFAQITDSENPVTRYSPYYTENCNLSADQKGYSIISSLANGSLHYSLDIKGSQSLYFDCYNGFSNSLVEEINGSFEVFVNKDVKSYSYPSQRENGLLYLGSFQNETVDITINLLKDTECSSFGVFGVDESILKNAITKTESLNLAAKGGKIKGQANKGDYFLSIPYSKDFKITLNGEKLEFSKALSGFVSLSIPRSGELEISLTPDGFYLGIVLSLAGILAAILLLRRKSKPYEKLQNAVFSFFMAGFLAVIMLVYIIPIIVNLSDLKF